MARNCLTKAIIIFLHLFILNLAGVNLHAQELAASETSSRFVNDQDYDSLIRLSSLPFAAKNNITLADFNTRLAANRYQLSEILQPLLQSRFSGLDERFINVDVDQGANLYRTIRLKYLNLAHEVIETSAKGTNAFAVLSARDFSDRILNFHSDVTVMPNGKLKVSEFIRVYNGNGQMGYDPQTHSLSEGNNDIQRGIVRDFPTSYEDKFGFWSEVPFDLKEVHKNGEPEAFNLESLSNGVRMKFGSKEVLLPEGVYEYRIDYETDRQLIFHKDKDEFYWNVNGNGWVFTADSISCMIHFPPGSNIKENTCYTGLQGATASNCEFRIIDGNSILFRASHLGSYEGLTVAVAIKKGILVPPSTFENAKAFIKSNYIIPALSGLLIFLLVYYYIVWSLKGRDPNTGVIYPRFSPPPELTPADVGYIMDQKFGSHLFASALVDFAVKKLLVIEVRQEGLIIKSPAYYFNKPVTTVQVPETTSTYGFNIDRLYGQAAQRGSYNSTLKSCFNSLDETLKKRFLIQKGKRNSVNGMFMLNKGYTRFGGFLLVVSIFLSLSFMVGHPSRTLLIITVLLLVALFTLHIVFVRIMGAYTNEGRKIADHLAGFKMYLDQAEQRVYENLTPPEKTLELFEKYLPFAIALKVENSWAAKFDTIMLQAVRQGYQPAYYTGMGHSFSMHSFSHGISSGLSGSISSASTPPSSSGGGSGGGGSSGGGGGGGGGGGW